MASSVQAHPTIRPFKKKAFPLFDQMAELCDDVIATGAGAFYAAGYGHISEVEEVGGDGEDDERVVSFDVTLAT